MITVEFLTAVLPRQGIICIGTYPHKSPTTGRDIMHHHTFTEPSKAASFAVMQSASLDVYFGCHTFREMTQRRSAKGVDYDWLERTAANALLCRVLYLDLDVGKSVGPDKKYPTQEAAIEALREFCRLIGLPKPLLINSGRGVHVYWLLDRDVPSAEWLEMAELLKRLCAYHGFLADPKVTADAARVLRIVGTWNRKDPEKPLRVRAFNTALPLLVAVPDILATLQKAAAELPEPEVVEAVSWVPEELPAPSVLAQTCATFAMMASEARTASEDVWWKTTQLVRFTTGGSKLAHKLAALHPDYVFEETQGRLDRAVAGGYGPPTCGKLQAMYGDASPCPTCAHFGQPHSSPVVFARRKPETELPEDVPPPDAPFYRTKRGVEYQPRPTPDMPVPPPAQVIYPYDFYPREIVDDPLRKAKAIEWTAALPFKGDVTVSVPIDAYTNEDKLVSTLANQGVTVDKVHAKRMGAYVSHYIQKLQALRAEKIQYATQGWVDGSEYTKFIWGNQMITADGMEQITVHPSAQNVAAVMQRKGTMAKQIAAQAFYNHPGYLMQQFFLCCALGAPLLHLTRMHGVVVNMSGPSGVSKSTSLAAGSGYYADPQRFVQNGTNSGMTQNARMGRMDTLGSVMMPLDEITNMPVEAVKEMALAVTQANRKVRLGSDGIERPVPESLKSSFMMTTSNNSLHSILALNNAAGNAGSMRVVEMLPELSRIHTKREADLFLIEIQDNFGHIGPEFVRLIIRDRVNIMRRMDKLRAEIDERGDIQPAERYWAATIAVAVMACAIANAKGWLPFDTDTLLTWALEVQLPRMRGVVGEAYLTPVGVLQSFLGEVSGSILVVEGQNRPGGMFPVREVRGELVGRLEPQQKALWLSTQAFRRYCDRHRLNFDATVRQLLAMGAVSRDKINLARHVDTYAGTQGLTLRVDLAHGELTGLPPIETPDGAQIIHFDAGLGVASRRTA